MTQTRTAILGCTLCLAGGSLGALVLVGWFAGMEPLLTGVTGRPPTAPDAAFALLLLGIAGALLNLRQPASLWQLLSRWIGAVVIAIGIEIAVRYAFGIHLPAGHFFFHNPAMPYPWRQSPPTAAALIFLGAAILFSGWHPEKRARPAEWLIVSASLIAITAVLGYLYGAQTFYQVSSAQIDGGPIPIAAMKALRFSAERLMLGVSVPGALGVLMICAGLLLGQPDSGIMRPFTAPGPGAALMKRLLPATTLIPVLLGLLAARYAGVEDVPLAFAALTAITMLASLLLLRITATHLNRAHDALEYLRKRACDFIDSASDGIFIADLDGWLIDVNQAASLLTGYSREELLTKSIGDLVPPEDAERFRVHRAKLLQGHEDVGEWMQVRKDGSRLPVEVSAKILPDGRWQGIVRDISERKRAENALRHAHERVELALKGGDLATWEWNVKTGEVIYNRRWADLRGFGPEETVPSIAAWSKGVHPEDWPTVENRLRDCFELRYPDFECEYRVSAKSGEWIWVLDRGKVFERDEHGKPTRMAGTELDMTARKRAEQQLGRDLDAMKRLQKLGALSAQAGNLEPVLSEIVDAAIAISGSDFGNIQLLDSVRGDLRIAAQRNFSPWWVDFWNSVTKGEGVCGTALARSERVMVEDVDRSPIFAGTPALDIQRKAGVRSVQSVPLVSRSGRTVGMLSTHYRTPHRPDDHMFRLFDLLAGQAADIIEHAQAEEALRLSQATALRAAQARDEVLGIVAHDLRNPLQIITLNAAFLRGSGPEPAREKAENVIDAAYRMNRLIQDLLDVTRIESGHLSLRLERLHVADIVSELVSMQTPIVKSASLELWDSTARDLPDIWADGHRIFQVFENLIGNAIKFTKARGHITLGAAAGTGEVLFSVSDTGSGIADGDLPHVFDRFWQATHGAHRGAGLGLAIVKGIVEAHGGRIWVQSTAGEGTTFFFTIPTVPKPGSSARTPSISQGCPATTGLRSGGESGDTAGVGRSGYSGRANDLYGDTLSAFQDVQKEHGLDVDRPLLEGDAFDRPVAMHASVAGHSSEAAADDCY